MPTLVSTGSLTITDVMDGKDAVYISLSALSWTASCAVDGTVLSWVGAESIATVMEGGVAGTGWTYNTPTTSDATKVQGVWTATTRKFQLQTFDKTLENGWVEFTATKGSVTLTARMTLSKSKVGTPATTYSIEPSISPLVREYDSGNKSPDLGLWALTNGTFITNETASANQQALEANASLAATLASPTIALSIGTWEVSFEAYCSGAVTKAIDVTIFSGSALATRTVTLGNTAVRYTLTLASSSSAMTSASLRFLATATAGTARIFNIYLTKLKQPPNITFSSYKVTGAGAKEDYLGWLKVLSTTYAGVESVLYSTGATAETSRDKVITPPIDCVSLTAQLHLNSTFTDMRDSETVPLTHRVGPVAPPVTGLSLAADSYFFKYDKDNVLQSAATITITLTGDSNLSATWTALLFAAGATTGTAVTLGAGAAANIKTLTATQFGSSARAEIKASIGAYEKTLTIQRAQDGEGVVAVGQSNGTHVLTCGNTGNVQDYTGSGNTIQVRLGTSETLQYETGTGNPTGDKKYKVVATGSGITPNATPSVSGKDCVYGVASGMADATNAATITYSVVVQVKGIVTTYSVVQSFSKSKAGTNGTNGTNGTYVSYVFKASATAPAAPTGAAPIPTGWSDSPPVSSDPVWMSKATVTNGAAGTWSTPVKVTGADGVDAGGGLRINYEYSKGTATAATATWQTSPYALATGEFGWMREKRIYPRVGNLNQARALFAWLNTTGTNGLLSDSADSIDGLVGVLGASSNYNPIYTPAMGLPAGSFVISFDAWLVSSGTRFLTVDLLPDTLPESGFTVTQTRQTFSAIWYSTHADLAYCLIRFFAPSGIELRVANIKLETGTFRTPWTRHVTDAIEYGTAYRVTGEKGADGANGLNSAVIYLYRRSTTAPALPSAAVTYTFSTKVVSGLTNSWTATIPAGTDPLYVTAATASSATDTDTIATNEWATATVLAQNGANGTNGSNGSNGSNGVDGLNSATVYIYQRSASAPTLPSAATTYTFSTKALTGLNNGWTTTIPTGTNPIYVSTATAVANTATDTIAATEWAAVQILAQNGAQGPQGPQGPQGAAGAQGNSLYTWIAYANNSTGTSGFTTGVWSGHTYIGIANNKTSATESTNAADYTWSLIKGDQGIPGSPGANGQTTYTWFAYANDATGSTGFTTGNWTNQTYMGIAANKTTATESTNPADYTWSKIQGAQGPQGPQGPQGTQGVQGPAGANGLTTYFHVAYATDANGGGFSQVSGPYIGTYVDTNPTDSSNPALYSWVKIQGSQGPTGNQGIPGVNGSNGQTSYLHIKYSDNGTSFTANNGETPGKWIGQYVDFVATDSNTFSAYTWSKIEGPTGPTGPTGPGGSNGAAGVRGSIHFVFNTSVTGVTYSASTWNSGATIDGYVTGTYGQSQGSGGVVVNGDVVTLVTTSTNYAQTAHRRSGAWSFLASYIKGDELIDGTLYVDKIVSNSIVAVSTNGNYTNTVFAGSNAWTELQGWIYPNPGYSSPHPAGSLVNLIITCSFDCPTDLTGVRIYIDTYIYNTRTSSYMWVTAIRDVWVKSSIYNARSFTATTNILVTVGPGAFYLRMAARQQGASWAMTSGATTFVVQEVWLAKNFPYTSAYVVANGTLPI